MIIFNQVYKREKEIELKDLTFSINRGEFVFIFNDRREILELLFKLISGEVRPDNGIIRWLKNFSYNSEANKREMGIVYNDNIFLPTRTIRENMNFIMEVRGGSQKYYESRVKKVLNIVGLFKKADCYPGELLPHQIVRANIAQALLNYPSIIILDDPTKNLDEVNSQAIFHLVEKINKLSTTVVFLSSDKDIIIRNRKRLINLERGKIIESFA